MIILIRSFLAGIFEGYCIFLTGRYAEKLTLPGVGSVVNAPNQINPSLKRGEFRKKTKPGSDFACFLVIDKYKSDIMEKESFNIDRYTPIEIDFTEEGYPEKARKLKPRIFQGGQRYYCLYGPDPDVGILGSGETALEALEDWEENLNLRIHNLAKSDQPTTS